MAGNKRETDGGNGFKQAKLSDSPDIDGQVIKPVDEDSILHEQRQYDAESLEKIFAKQGVPERPVLEDEFNGEPQLGQLAGKNTCNPDTKIYQYSRYDG